MVATTNADNLALEIARRWCVTKGSTWAVVEQAGRGGTAPVFSVESPEGPRALKIYDLEFSAGQKGDIEKLRIDQQVALGAHSCPYMVQVFEGGLFEDRLFLLMNKAPGAELEKRLTAIPRDKIRSILDQITQAVVFLRGKNICHRDIKSANVYISDDFEHATLLDLSVMRDIHDPVGIGTDHDGQLPILATARYSPPEYLFRLIEPGPELWHALDVYQLGGLLHDLIMKQPMFADEYSRSKENRYRFAWAVATAAPEIQAHDVDQDLIFTARRALDKNWERRSNLKLDDFLIDNAKQQTNALAVLGLAVAGSPVRDDSPTIPVLRARTREVATALETRLVEYLKRMGVTTTHINEHGDEGDASKRLRFAWKSNVAASEGLDGDIEYSYCLTAEATPDGTIFKSTASLRGTINSTPREENITLPDVPDTPAASDRLGLSAETTIGALAQKLLKAA